MRTAFAAGAAKREKVWRGLGAAIAGGDFPSPAEPAGEKNPQPPEAIHEQTRKERDI